jgi:hypothetical protein
MISPLPLFSLWRRALTQPLVAVSLYRPLDGGPCAVLANFSFLVVSFVQGQHAATPAYHQGKVQRIVADISFGAIHGPSIAKRLQRRYRPSSCHGIVGSDGTRRCMTHGRSTVMGFGAGAGFTGFGSGGLPVRCGFT